MNDRNRCCVYSAGMSVFKFCVISGTILFGTSSSVLGATAPFMNLIGYRSELFKLKGPNDDRCPMNLRIRPSLRAAVLKDGRSYDWLVGGESYSEDQIKIDHQWAFNLQASQKYERSEIESQLQLSSPGQSPWISYQDQNLDRLRGYRFYPGFYSVENFVSYQVGNPRMPWGKDRGFTFKVFFEFKNPQTDLTPDLYKKFSSELSKAGFEGDSKIPVLPGWIRFTWNNLIVHATTMKSALTAERIGLKFFGDLLASYSRGVDVSSAVNPAAIIDWPHFLCSEDASTLPADVYDFVQNK